MKLQVGGSSAALQSSEVVDSKSEVSVLTTLLVMALVLVAGYFACFQYLWSYWNGDQYAHGYLIPAFAAFFLYYKHLDVRDAGGSLVGAVAPWERWTGLGILVATLAARVYFAKANFPLQQAFTFLPAIFAIFLMVGGLKVLSWAWPGLVFLVFMYPLPGSITRVMLYRLKSIATRISGVLLQTIGYDAYWQGNVINIEGVDLGVVEACSGLKMLTIFIAFAVAFALMIRRPLWERIAIMLSSVPIALFANVFRITLTGMLYALKWDSELVNKVFHDFAGFVMLPVAAAVLYVEYLILSNLIIEEEAVSVSEVGPLKRPVVSPARG